MTVWAWRLYTLVTLAPAVADLVCGLGWAPTRAGRWVWGNTRALWRQEAAWRRRGW